jgi:uncharacterized protein YecE (DUF72 family)
MSEVPEFADDSSIQELANDDPLSNSPVKGAIKWNQRDNRYDFVWWQTPFWIATENGGYSMTKEFLDQLPGHLEHIWVVDENTDTFKRFAREQYEEEGTVVSPDDPRFENVTPNEQVAVDREKARETYDLSDVEL